MGRFTAIVNLDGAPTGQRGGTRLPDFSQQGPVALHGRDIAFTRDGSCVLAADLRLDNRADLARDLGLTNSSGLTDADLLLQAYGRWGEECPSRLLGDFSFALWDGRRHILFCARDQVGVRQFYYFESPRLFACATSADTLIEDASIPAAPDSEALALSLADRFPNSDRTWYAGIRRLPPGHCVRVNRQGVQVRRYHAWTGIQPERYRYRAEATERFRQLFGEAVECRLSRSDATAATLSGGLDSASIVCMARAVRPHCDLRAYALVFPGLACDESRWIEDASGAAGVPVEKLAPGSEDLLDAKYSGVPTDLTFSMTYGLIARAASHGARVLLWGFGGDELLTSGTAYMTDLVRRREYRAAIETVRERARYYGESPIRLALEVLKPFAPAAIRRLRSAASRRTRPPWLNVPVPEPEQPKRVFRSETSGGLYRSLCSGRLVDYTLPGMEALSAATGLDFRYPFLDRRLIEFALGLPIEHSALLASKLVLRDALAGILPKSISTRLDKAGFDPFINQELRGRQADIISSFIRNSELARLGIIAAGPLMRCFENYRSGQSDGSGNHIAAFIRTELWLRALQRRRRNQDDESSERADCHREEAVLCP